MVGESPSDHSYFLHTSLKKVMSSDDPSKRELFPHLFKTFVFLCKDSDELF